jgi:hypothetical protein
MAAHPIQWQAPQPLWGRFGSSVAAAAVAGDQRRPAILRFATDNFMDELLATLARDPSRIDALVARPESWRSPMKANAPLVEHTPVPLAAAQARRSRLALKAKAAVAATTSEAPDPNARGAARSLPLKLYQPAHQRFYVVTSSLVCGTAGMPERAIDAGAGELVSFVIRRMLPAIPGQAANPREFAFVKDASGASWRRVSTGADDAQAVFGEELLPVFPLAFQDDAGRDRRLWGGFVPVGRREEYVASRVDRSAPVPYAQAQREGLAAAAPPATPSKMARVAQFQGEVAEPWKNLIRSSVKLAASLAQVVKIGSETEPTGSGSTKPRRVLDFNLAQQNASWLVLLDFADYLESHLPDVWNAIAGSGAGFAAMSQPRKDLYTWLGTASMTAALAGAMKGTDGKPDRPVQASLREALAAIRANGVREKLEAMTLSYTTDPASRDSSDWPPFHFVLAGVDGGFSATGPYTALATLAASTSTDFAPDPKTTPDTAPQANDVDRLTALVGRALEASTEAGAPPLPFALEMKNALAANAGDAAWFVIRFVHQRRDCGPLHAPLLSAPTQAFQLAGFFDPDAPARPIRIALPLDTSPAGLRKFNKNAAFILSDMLCGQVQRAKGLGFIDLVLSVLPWPLHKDLDVGAGGPCNDGSASIGMICSISIPIITICALIILMIMITLLDIVFRWLPFFILCFPVPKFKGKP